MSKGRAGSKAGRSKAGHDADGLRESDPLDPFDSLEPFEAYDLADRRRFSTAAARSGAPVEPASQHAHESTYTRSRRSSADVPSTSQSADSPKRPVRSLKARALGYLSRREYSRAELSRKLMPFAEEADSVETLLDTLEREGWLSDSRFAESLVHRRAARMGASRIVSELKRHAVGDALIEEVGAQLRESEFARAQAVWRKKYGQLPETPAERARQARFLAMRGFSRGTIVKILKGSDDDWAGG